MRLPNSLFLRAALMGGMVTFVLPAIVALPLAPAIARSAPDSFADLAEKLLPAVVNISSSQNIPIPLLKQPLPASYWKKPAIALRNLNTWVILLQILLLTAT